MINQNRESIGIDDHGAQYIKVFHLLCRESFNISLFMVEFVFHSYTIAHIALPTCPRDAEGLGTAGAGAPGISGTHAAGSRLYAF